MGTPVSPWDSMSECKENKMLSYKANKVNSVTALAHVLAGPPAAQEYTQTVHHWWDTEIAPWKSIVLGRWDAVQFDA